MSRRRTSPARSSRSSMSRFSARTRAEKRSTPSSRARSASRREQRRAQPAALRVVGDRHRRLGEAAILAVAHEAGHADPAPVGGVERDQRLVVVVVDLGQVRELGVGEPGLRREEPAIARLGAQALERLRQRAAVLGHHRPHERRGPVAQLDPLAGRLGHARRLSAPVVCRRRRRHRAHARSGARP